VVALIAIMPPTIVVTVMIILLMTGFRDAIPDESGRSHSDERTFRSHALRRAPLLIVGSGAAHAQSCGERNGSNF
jgi:hypothetical protein